MLAERCRGSEVRYFEDTQIGDTFGPLLKGPLSIMDGVAWTAATQGFASQALASRTDGRAANRWSPGRVICLPIGLAMTGFCIVCGSTCTPMQRWAIPRRGTAR